MRLARIIATGMMMLLLLAGAIAAQDAAADDAATSPTAAAHAASARLALVREEAVGLVGAKDLSLESRLDASAALLEAAPGDAIVLSARGELLMEAEEDDAALRAFEAAVAADPTLHSAWHWIGILKKRDRRDLAGALHAFRKAIEHGAAEAEELNEIGVTLALMRNMREALETFQRAIELNAQNGIYYANAVNAAVSLREDTTARRLFERGIDAERFEPQLVRIWCGYLVDTNRAAEALTAYEQALLRQPRNVVVRHEYAITLREEGRNDDALEQLRLAQHEATAANDLRMQDIVRKTLFAIENRREMERLIEAEGLVLSTQTSTRALTRDLNRAVTLLDPIVRDYPDQWEALMLRGMAYRRLERDLQARQDFEAVIAKRPDQPNAHMNLALLFHDQQVYYRAVEHATHAISLAPRDPSVLANAVVVYSAADRCEDAVRLMRRLRRISPPMDNPQEDPLTPLEQRLQEMCREYLFQQNP